MAWLSLAEQDRRIRRDWPFRAVLLGRDLALWRGTVTGLSAPYDISILYALNPEQDGFEYNHAWFPEVRVHAPLLTRCPQAPDIPIPHVYEEGLSPRPMLCLFDPAERGWWPDMAIADTTLPLVGDWLRFYEAWIATGVWTGGGRDHAGIGPPPAAGGACPPDLIRQIERAAKMAASRAVLAASLLTPLAGPPARSQLNDLLNLPRRLEARAASLLPPLLQLAA